MYTPDNWVILEIEDSKGIFHRVLAGWRGGYTTGDAWRMNSGITQIEEEENKYLVHGFSGSTYSLLKYSERFSPITSGIFSRLIEISKEQKIPVKTVEMESILEKYKLKEK